MTKPEDFIEERLEKLGQATAQVVPDDGFDRWIVDAAQRESAARWLVVPWRVGGVALAVGALAAAASIVLALQTQSDLDEELVVASDWVEIGP